MEYKTVQCREHGGNFRIPSQRGRPPVRCGMQTSGKSYPSCDMAPGNKKARSTKAVGVAKAVSRTLKGAVPKPSASSKRVGADTTGAQRRRAKVVSEASPVIVKHNPSIPLAKKAKDQLEPLGWECKATKDDDTASVEFIARRGEEVLIIRWRDGKPIDQTYFLWDPDKTPGQNGKPKSRLPWNPDEMTDAELAYELMGKEIQWWNRLKQGSEKATVSTKQVKIEHTFYDPNASDEDEEENENGHREPLRIVSFVDPSGGGYRSFHVEALMRVRM